MTDTATSAAAMHRFAERGEVTMPGRRVVDLHFDGPAPYHDRAGVIPPLRWTADSGAPPAVVSGVALDGFPWLQSERPATALPGFLHASNALTLRVVCASDDVAQGGPARIVSNSVDTGLRNFTVGQEASSLVMRLRTPHTGLSGARPEVVVPDVFTDHRTQDILITYDGARMLIAVARSGRVERTEFTPGSSLAPQLTSLTIEARELPALGAVFIAVLFFVPGVVLGVLGRERQRVVIGVVWLLSFAALLEGTLAMASGRPFSWSHATGNAALGALAFAVGVLICPPYRPAVGDVMCPSALPPERSIQR